MIKFKNYSPVGKTKTRKRRIDFYIILGANSATTFLKSENDLREPCIDSLQF